MTPAEMKQEARELLNKVPHDLRISHVNMDWLCDLESAIESFGQRCFEAGRVQALPSEDEFEREYTRPEPNKHWSRRDSADDFRNGAWSVWEWLHAREWLRARMASNDSETP